MTISKLFENAINKNELGYINELLISGNLKKHNYKVKVLQDHNPNYDIRLNYNDNINYLECKLDNISDVTTHQK